MSKQPKRISFFWGKSKMSWLRYMTLWSFRRLHPDWEMYLYVCDFDPKIVSMWTTHHKQDFFNYKKGDDCFDMVEDLGVNIVEWKNEAIKELPLKDIKELPPSQNSNFFKWSLLRDEGGVYSDMDIIYLKSIDSLYNDFVYGKGNVAMTHNGKYFSIGFMMSSINNEVFKAIYDNTIKNFRWWTYQGAGAELLVEKWGRETGFDNLKRDFPNSIFYDIPMKHFYLLNSEDLPKIFTQDFFNSVLEECIGLHWYAGGQLAQEYNNWVSPSNYNSRECTISRVLKHVLEN